MPPHRSGQSRDSLLNGSRDTSYICNKTFNRVGPSPRVVTPMTATPLLDRISSVDDLRRLSEGDLQNLASELRTATISAVSKTGGHLGAGQGRECPDDRDGGERARVRPREHGRRVTCNL